MFTMKAFLILAAAALVPAFAHASERYECRPVFHPVDFFASFELTLDGAPENGTAYVDHVTVNPESSFPGEGDGSGQIDPSYNSAKFKDSVRYHLKMKGPWCPQIGSCHWDLILQKALFTGGAPQGDRKMGGIVSVSEGGYASYQRFACDAK